MECISNNFDIFKTIFEILFDANKEVSSTISFLLTLEGEKAAASRHRGIIIPNRLRAAH